ncbi:MAG TPA: sigma 54-interacting transcriptional regulator, partial [Kofleriaceae bacterium]
MADGVDVPTVSLFQERPRAGHILLIQDGSSSMHPLPRNGVVLIGRLPEAQLRLTDTACSRRHAEVVVEDGEISVRDLGSHNGTRVNGVQFAGVRRVAAGDVVSVGEVIMVVHAEPVEARRRFLDFAAFRQRLGEELERAARYERELAVIAVGAEEAGLEKPLEAALARLDVATMTADGALVLLLEVDADTALARAKEFVEACAKSRAGLACCPDDGCRADTLIAAARAAAQSAAPGGVCVPSDAVIRLQIGDRRALVADSATAQLFQLLKRLATSDLPVLVVGETGSGKENAAHALHNWSRRGSKPFVAFNAAALQETLAESELFGHEKG